MLERMHELQEKEGLVSAELIAGFISRQVQPLQRRCHWMSDMSLHWDPTRTSIVELSRGQVLDRMHAIADLKLKDDW